MGGEKENIMTIKTIELQYDDRHPDKKVLINKKGHKFYFSSNSELVDFLYEAKELNLADAVPQSEQLPCEHEYKAIYLGMGYVKECQKCGDIHQ